MNTPTEKPQGAGAVPPRVWIYDHFAERAKSGYACAWFKKQDGSELEYISLEEHTALLQEKDKEIEELKRRLNG